MAWLKQFLGGKAFVISMLKHGAFDWVDMRNCAHVYDNNNSVEQSAVRKGRDLELRRSALKARKELREAKRMASWKDQGWNYKSWERKQIMLLETGELAERVRKTNVAYGFGAGAETPLTRDQAMTIEVFTNQQVKAYRGRHY